ncbi:uncharacterized protein LOC135816320 [Sycon ciliatum]|uniref:uncharacterized protein LOC135816320 n=1 Tax=Sycon ciliatum TaxID=27933 RepID=UPI0031F64EF0|eukprot:scpid18415/ scgid20769/ Rho guanine nucleotide exchange factor 11; PDZ-RhoGEF
MAEGPLPNGGEPIPTPTPTPVPTSRPYTLYVVGQFVDEILQFDVSQCDESHPFKSLEMLVQRPAYLAMFLKHLHESKGYEATVPLLFLLRCGSYYHITKGLVDGKGAKRQAQSVIHTFLSQNSPWSMAVDPVKLEEVETIYRKKDLTIEEATVLFNSLALDVAEGISAQLETYRQTLKAEDDDDTLQEDLDKSSEYQITQKTLSTIIPQSAYTNQDGAYAMLLTSMALAMGLDSKSAFLEKLANLQQKGVLGASPSSALYTRGKGKHQVHIVVGHNFVATHYNSPTFCDYCNGLLWGIGNQGYTCQLCNYNVHKATCNQSITEYCRGEPKEGAGSLFRRGSLKPSFSGSFRQGVRPSSSRCSVESEPLDGEGSHKRMLTPLHSVGASSIGTSDTASIDSGLIDRSSLYSEQRSQSAASTSSSTFYGLRRGPSSASTNSSELARTTTKILRAQSMKVSNANDKGKSVGQTPTQTSGLVSGTRRSIDTGQLESPFAGRDDTPSVPSPVNDPDLNVDEDLVPWSIRTPAEAINDMSRRDVKQQDLCHELVHTEQTHVKKLKVIFHIFYRTLMQSELFPSKLVDALFPSLELLMDFHVDLMNGLKACLDSEDHSKAKDIGAVLVEFFSGERGQQSREAASEWVKLRQVNLDFIKQFSSKQPKLSQLMAQCEANPSCTRLKLADLTSVVMQRFTKYPLLLESIQKVTDQEETEYDQLTKAIDLSRRILEQINQDVMEFENNRTLFELQSRIEFKNMDRLTGALAPFRTLDISSRELIHRGELKWRMKGKLVTVDAILFPDIVVLLEHNEDKSRYYLRVREDFTPIITLKDLLPPREVASDKERKSFLLVWLTTSGSRMYELSAASSDASEKWRVKISDAIAASKGGTVTVTSQSYSKNIKAYVMRAHVNYARSMSAQDTVDLSDQQRRPTTEEETATSPADDSSSVLSPKSSTETVGTTQEDAVSLASTLATASPKLLEHAERTERTPTPTAKHATPTSLSANRNSSPPEQQDRVPKMASSYMSLSSSDLVAVLENCMGQMRHLGGIAQDAIKENQSRGRSIRSKSNSSSSGSASTRMFSTIDSLHGQLKTALDLAKKAVDEVSSARTAIADMDNESTRSEHASPALTPTKTEPLKHISEATSVADLESQPESLPESRPDSRQSSPSNSSMIKKTMSCVKKDVVRRFAQVAEEPSQLKRSWSDSPAYSNSRADAVRALRNKKVSNLSSVNIPHLSIDCSAAQKQQQLDIA